MPFGEVADLKAAEPPESSARDLKFASANPYPELGVSFIWETKEVRLWPVIHAFRSNIQRLESMLYLPKYLTWLSRSYERKYCQSLLEVTQGIATNDLPQSQVEEVNGKLNELLARWIEEVKTQRIHFVGGEVEQVGTRSIDALLPIGGGIAWLGLESILIGQITGAWTAFEVLVGDLWEAALNCHPETLSTLKGSRKPGGTTEGKQKDDKQIALDLLGLHGYDLSNKMGTILRDKLGFATLERARECYSMAFDDKKITDVIVRPCIDTLQSVRNVFVHKAGFADKVFKSNTAGISLFSTVMIKQRIPIDGPLIQSCIRPVMHCAMELISLVSEWIVDHPQSGGE